LHELLLRPLQLHYLVISFYEISFGIAAYGSSF
jgi:hypothetical protein